MELLTLTNRQARRFLLAHQGLFPPHQLKTKDDLLGFIRRAGCIQFDPLTLRHLDPLTLIVFDPSTHDPLTLRLYNLERGKSMKKLGIIFVSIIVVGLLLNIPEANAAQSSAGIKDAWESNSKMMGKENEYVPNE